MTPTHKHLYFIAPVYQFGDFFFLAFHLTLYLCQTLCMKRSNTAYMKNFKFNFLSILLLSLVFVGCKDNGPDIDVDQPIATKKEDVTFKFFRLEEKNGAEIKNGSPMHFQIAIVTEIGVKSLKASIIDTSMSHTQAILDEKYDDNPLTTITLQYDFEMDNFCLPELQVLIEAVDVNDKYYSMDTTLAFSDYMTYVGDVVLLDSFIGYVNTDNVRFQVGLDLVNNLYVTSSNPGSINDWDVVLRTSEDLAKSGRPLMTQIYRFREPQNAYAVLTDLNAMSEADIRIHHVDESATKATFSERLAFYDEDNFTGGWILVKLRDNKHNKKWSLLHVYDVFKDVTNPKWNILVGKTKYKARLYERPYNE